MRFRLFLEEAKNSFVFQDVEIEICEVPLASCEEMLLERADPGLLNFIRDRVSHFAKQVSSVYDHPAPAALGVPDVQVEPEEKQTEPATEENLRKFRVTLRYPRSKRKAWLGHYVKDTMYVYAKSKADAKSRAEEYIRTKLEPVENDEMRRFPKYNYLKNVKRKHLETDASRVNNWGDLVATLRHISNNRGELTPLDYLDENDLKIILKAAKGRNFLDLLKRLTPKEQKLLKRFYFHMAQSPWLSPETKSMIGSLEPTMRMLGGKKLPYEREIGEEDATEPEPEWDFWSVFEPKTQQELDRMLNRISSVKDVFEVARRFGIAPKELRMYKDSLFNHENEHIEQEKLLFKHLRKALKVSPNNRIFETDWNNPDWVRKYGVHWGELINNLLTSRETYVNALPFADSGNPDETKTREDAANWIWQFYQRGMPKKKTPLEQLEFSLRKLLEYRERALTKNKPSQDIPF